MLKKIKYIILILIIITLSGCYNYKELNDSAIVSAISIDINDNKTDKYTIGVQIMNAKKKENTNVSEIAFYEADGATIYDALGQIVLSSPKELYLGHMEVVVLGEELLKKKEPLEYLDFFMRDSSAEKDAVVIVAKEDNAKNILKVITPLETIPSQNLKASLFNSANLSGTTNIITLDELVSNLMEEGKESVLPAVVLTGSAKEGESQDNIKDSDPDVRIKFDNLAVLKNGKLIGYLNENESFGFNIVTADAKNTYIKIKCDNENFATLEITSLKTNEEISFKNKKPNVTIKTSAKTNIIEYNCKMNFINDDKLIGEIEKKAEKRIERLINSFLEKSYNKYQTDTLHYGSVFYKEKEKQMKKHGYTNKTIKKDITFNVNADVKVDGNGLTLKSVN